MLLFSLKAFVIFFIQTYFFESLKKCLVLYNYIRDSAFSVKFCFYNVITLHHLLLMTDLANN